MAAQEYFQASYGHPASSPYKDYTRDEGVPSPLSRIPSNTSLGYPSTYRSPRYDDGDSYRPQSSLHPVPSQTMFGNGGRLLDDELEGGQSIQMGTRRKHDSQMSVAPILPVPPSDDPFVRDIKPGKPRSIPRHGPKSWLKGRITWVVYTLSLVQLVVFIVELVKNGMLTGTPIEIHPSFNPMIGPSPYVLINMGARYQPCMHNMPGVQDATTNIYWPCPNATSTTGADVSCSLSQLCGFDGVPNPQVGGSIDEKPAPNQWYRFIVPIFLHAGIIHIGFNLLLQLTLGRDVEKLIGPIRFSLVYFASGIFGFVLGGNYAANGIASCGCSGSLFGILAITLLDLLYNWRDRRSPIKDLLFIGVDIIIAFVLGLLPGLDNFSHIGGFLMGVVLGICILRSPPAFRTRSIAYTQPYNPAESPDNPRRAGRRDASQFHGEGLLGFIKGPVEFFRYRRPIWWGWWLVRAAALICSLVGFILLLKNFYQWRNGCGWCKYLSCMPINNWCSVGNLHFTPTNKRAVMEVARAVFEGM